MAKCLQTFRGLRELSIIWVALADCPTVRNIEELRKLHVNFCTNDQDEEVPVRPVADLSTLPKLHEITLSTGWMEDTGPSSLNCHFTGHSESVRTLTVESESQQGYQLASPLSAALTKFSHLQHLVLYNIRSQKLGNTDLPFLETLESYWCSPKTTLGIKVPRLKDLSVAIAAQGSGDHVWEILDLLDSATRIVIRIEWDIFNRTTPPDAINNGKLLDIHRVYSTLKERPREACLIAGDVTGPGESIPWLRYRRRARPDPSRTIGVRRSPDRDMPYAKRHKKERLKSLRKLGLANVFRDSQEQDCELGKST